MMRLGCTIAEAADVVGVDRRTISRWARLDPDVKRAIESGKSKRNAHIRRLQMKAAEAGDSRMLIFLGKVFLGQSDRIELSSDPDRPVQVEHTMQIAQALTQQKEKLMELRRVIDIEAAKPRMIEASPSEDAVQSAAPSM